MIISRLCVLFMSEGRHRRTNPKRKRDEIYSYEAFDKDNDEQNDSEDEPLEEVSEEYEDDDSFTYGPNRPRKADSKRRRVRSKAAVKGEKKGRAKKDEKRTKGQKEEGG